MPIMAWFLNLGPQDQRNDQEQLGINFGRLVQVREEREKTQNERYKEKKTQLQKQGKNVTPQEREKE